MPFTSEHSFETLPSVASVGDGYSTIFAVTPSAVAGASGANVACVAPGDAGVAAGFSSSADPAARGRRWRIRVSACEPAIGATQQWGRKTCVGRGAGSEELPLLNPYTDDPSDHLIALGPMVVRQPHSDRGLLTERRLDLNRAALIERRAERLNDVATLVDQIARTTSPGIREVLPAQASEECLADKEFSFVVAAYVAQVRSALADA